MKDESNLFFSVVIPTYERPADLRVCLNSFSEILQKDSPSFEIIVTDDSQSDESKKLIAKEFPNACWGKGKQNGPAGNRNAGVNRAKGEWIVFLDDDCIAQKGYLGAYAKAIYNNPNVQVFEGRIFADRAKNSWAEGCPENEHGGMLWTSNLCVKKSLFFEIGKFDERFKVAFEDVEFAHRLKLRKIKTLFIYEAAVCHPWRSLQQGGKNWKKRGYEIESLLLFVEKHGTNEQANLKLYLRYFLRTITTDQIKSIMEFKCKGYSFLINQIITILLSIFLLMRFEWEKFIRKS
jgi:GT2 family glycosyltransferase